MTWRWCSVICLAWPGHGPYQQKRGSCFCLSQFQGFIGACIGLPVYDLKQRATELKPQTTSADVMMIRKTRERLNRIHTPKLILSIYVVVDYSSRKLPDNIHSCMHEFQTFLRVLLFKPTDIKKNISYPLLSPNTLQ